MGFGKFLLGGLCAVGAVVAAPVVLPVAAAAGTAVAGAATAVGTAVGGVATAAGTVVGGVATAAGTTVAGTAVGTAAVGTMSAIGGAVGTAAGAVGLSSVATIAGTSAGAAAVGTITTSATIGAIGAISGAEKMMEASKTKEEAVSRYENERKIFDEVERDVNSDLEKLGTLKLNIWESFNRFINAIKKIGSIEELKELGLDEMLNFEKDELDNINDIGLKTKDIVEGGAISAIGGKLAGIATSAGITEVFASSMGIAGLHGAAAANASLAAFGGGSLASGGLGMAGGATVLQGLAFAPALAISGLFLNGKGKANLKIADETKEEVDKLAIQMNEGKQELYKLQKLSKKVYDELHKYKAWYDFFVDWLEQFVEKKENLKLLHLPKESKERSEFQKSEDGKKFLVTGQIASILKNLTSTKLITKDNENGIAKIEEESVNKEIESSDMKWEYACSRLNEEERLLI